MAVPWDVGSVNQLLQGDQAKSSSKEDRVSAPTSKMSRRQQELDSYWRFYRCSHYAGRKYDWNGREHFAGAQKEAIATSGFIPPGFEDVEGSMVPLEYRKPSYEYNLCKVIVQRFNGLLFGEGKQPKIGSDDERTEDWLQGFVEATDFWSEMLQLRTYGGAMGSAALGFKFVGGEPEIEIFDPRWCTPTFLDRKKMKLKQLEQCYQFIEEEWDREEGEWVEVCYWYRRVLTRHTDSVWTKVPVRKNELPDWRQEAHETVRHNLGEVPAEWVQNEPVDDSVDGDPDCHGIFDDIFVIDGLWSQANRGTLANCLGKETCFITAEGVRSFEDFSDGDAVSVLTHRGRFRQARVRSYGNQQLLSVRVGRGRNSQTIRATENHRWLLEDRTSILTTSEAQQLRPSLCKPPHLIRDWLYDDASEEERIWWSRGFGFGDGSLSRGPNGQTYGTRVRLCGAKTRFLSRFEDLGWEPRFPKHAAGEPIIYMRDYDKALPSLAEIGVVNMTAFVRGYLDADGSRNTRHPELCEINPFQGIQATGKAAVAFIREIFPVVGAYIVAEDDRTEVATNYTSERDITVYFSLVLGFSSSPVAAYRVREVEESSYETVWCLEVEDDHSFVLPSGVVTLNCDPTPVFSSDSEFETEITKGSGVAIHLEKGASASYLEISGAGIEKAMVLAEKFEERALIVAQCVLDRNEGGPSRTASEVEHNYSAMVERANRFRKHYGRAIKRLLEKVLRAARSKTGKRLDKTGEIPRIVRSEIKLPKRKVVDPETGDVLGWADRVLGEGEQVELTWPDYFEPSTDVVSGDVEAASLAKEKGLVDQATAVRHVAKHFKVENVSAMLGNIRAEQEALQQMMLGGPEQPKQEGGSPAPPGGWAPGEGGSPAPPGGFEPAEG